MRLSRPALLLGAALTTMGLTMAPLAANAAVPQDWRSGECHVDVNLDQHRLVLQNNSEAAHVTGTLSNPNNCPLDLPTLGYALKLSSAAHPGDEGSSVDQYGNVDFAFGNNSLTNSQVQTLGLLDIGTDNLDYIYEGGKYAYDHKVGPVIIDNAAQQRVDVRYASRTSLKVSRGYIARKGAKPIHIGSYATLTATSQRFHYSNPYAPSSWGTAYQPRVQLQQYRGGAWHTIKTLKANYKGVVSAKVKAKKGSKFRAVSQELWYVWPSTSKAVKK